MEDKELYGSFTKEEMDRYTEEARQRWGHSEAFKQSTEKFEKMDRMEMNRVIKEASEPLKDIVLQMTYDPKSECIQNLIAKHYDSLSVFYEPNPEIYRGLADLYVSDERFKAFFEKSAEGLAQFMHDAMIHFVDVQEAKNE